MVEAAHDTFRGPMVPVLTHYRDDGAIDVETIRASVRDLIERGIRFGSGALLAVGAGGDFPMLSLEERKAAATAVFEGADGRAPVIVGAQDTSVQRMIELARFAEELGAQAIQLSPPYYYNATADDCYEVFRTVIEATSRIGVMIYNTPWEGYSMTLADVERLLSLPRTVCLKWSTDLGPAIYNRGVARFADRVPVIDNQGMHVMNRILGGTGYITHLATVWPEHDLHVWSLLESGEFQAAQELISRVNWPWYDFRVKMAAQTSGESPVVKAALELCGRTGGPCRLPSRSLNAEERAELREILQRIGVPGVQ